MAIPPNQYAFTDEFWREQPRFTLPDDHFESCELHGEWCVNAYYDAMDVSKMLVEGRIDCPLCLCEIVGVEA